MDVEAEIRELKRRVDNLEGAVTVLAGKVGNLHPELQTLKETSVDRFDKIEDAMSRFVNRLDMVNTQIWSLRDDFPEIIDKAIRSRRSE
jgi:predicted  nucleic acid-binding Zn-ribbon protein